MTEQEKKRIREVISSYAAAMEVLKGKAGMDIVEAIRKDIAG